MNWKRLKEKYPKTYEELRVFNSELEGRTLINEFLKSKGYKIGFTFIDKLKDYENKTNRRERKGY